MGHHDPGDTKAPLRWELRRKTARRTGAVATKPARDETLPLDLFGDSPQAGAWSPDPTIGFPAERLNELVRVEGRGPEISRPPLYLHKWWARRFGSVFRSILLSLLLGDREDLWRAHYRGHRFADQVICDPFMGGGTTLFEAIRLGAAVVGCDINPVAWWASRTALRQPGCWAELEGAFEELRRQAAALFGGYYTTMCPTCCAPTATVRHIRWVRVFACGHCSTEVPVFRSHVLGKSGGGHWLRCPCCGFVYWSTCGADDRTACPRCSGAFIPDAGNTRAGDFVCSACGSSTNIRAASSARRDPVGAARPFAVVFDCETHGWGLTETTSIDVENHARAAAALARGDLDLAIPAGAIDTVSRTDPRPANYGYTRWSQLFTPRQALVLGWLAARVRDLGGDVGDTLATVVSQMTNYTNTFCVPRPNRPGAISWIFRMHAFVPPTDFVEANPLAGERCSGTFENLFRRSVRGAYEYRERPCERRLDPANRARSVSVPVPGETVKPTLVADWSAGAGAPGTALLLCQPSSALPLPDKSVSHVVTDPPFYDNVAYGELSEFNYAWLHVMLGHRHEEFRTPKMDHKDEVIASRRIGKGADFYGSGLLAVFRECNRVLKDDGKLALTFHHRAPAAWASLLEALTGAGFQVEATHAVASESDRSLHIMTGDSIERDVVMICRKAGLRPNVAWNDLERRMRDEAGCIVGGLDAPTRRSRANVATLLFGLFMRLLSESAAVRDGNVAVPISEAVNAAADIARELADSL
jgi:SAM-dependent methyltransferase